MAFNVSLDTSELHRLVNVLKVGQKDIQKAVARYLGDQAWEFKKNAPKILDSTYTIRDKKFVENRAFTVKRPKANVPINEQQAIAASLRIDGSGGLFTGWEEELTGAPREMRNKGGRGTYRQMWSNAREDGSVYGLSLRQYRLRTESDRIPDSSQYGIPIPQFLAMIAKSDASGRNKRAKHFKAKDYALGKNKVFIMEDGEKHPRGLYTFKDGKVKALQTFSESPVVSNVGKFDWRGQTEKDILKKFHPAYIFEKYLAPAIMALFTKK